MNNPNAQSHGVESANRGHVVTSGEGPCIVYSGQVTNVKLGAFESRGEMTIVEQLIPPGCGPPLSVHERENVDCYVLEGQFEFVFGKQTIRGGPGTFVHMPRHLPNSYKNVGAVHGRVLLTYTPGGIEDYFRELGVAPDHSAETAERIGRRHGITQVA